MPAERIPISFQSPNISDVFDFYRNTFERQMWSIRDIRMAERWAVEIGKGAEYRRMPQLHELIKEPQVAENGDDYF